MFSVGQLSVVLKQVGTCPLKVQPLSPGLLWLLCLWTLWWERNVSWRLPLPQRVRSRRGLPFLTRGWFLSYQGNIREICQHEMLSHIHLVLWYCNQKKFFFSKMYNRPKKEKIDKSDHSKNFFKLLCIRGRNQQREKAAYGIGDSICKSHVW